jgi:hypothetical protein
MKYLISSLLLLALIFQSCSVEKRHYTSGYHLQWKKGNDSEPKTVPQSAQSLKSKNDKLIQNTITASSEKKKGIVLFTPDSTGCDTLIMRDETEIKVKVIEITPTEIKYKYCDNITGPTYVVYRYNVAHIKYANGRREFFENKQLAKSDKELYPNSISEEEVRKGQIVKRLAKTSIGFSPYSFIPLVGIPAGIIAIIFGIICLIKAGKDKSLRHYKVLAIIGITLGLLGLIGNIIFIGLLSTNNSYIGVI